MRAVCQKGGHAPPYHCDNKEGITGASSHWGLWPNGDTCYRRGQQQYSWIKWVSSHRGL